MICKGVMIAPNKSKGQRKRGVCPLRKSLSQSMYTMLKVPKQAVNELKEARERVRKARIATMPGIGKVQLVVKAIKRSFVDREGIIAWRGSTNQRLSCLS